MITKYNDFWEFIKDVRKLHNTIVVVPEHFNNYATQMSTSSYKQLMTILKTNNIKVLEMKNNVKNNFKAK